MDVFRPASCAPSCFMAVALVLFLSIGSGTVLGGEPGKEHGHEHGHGHDGSGQGPDHGHHHAAPEAYKRTVAPYAIPDVTLKGTDGKGIPLREALGGGKPVIMNFIFTTCPTICPLLTASFSRLSEDLGADRDKIRMVSITIDPEYDTPARMKEYAERFSADPGWLFLTGSFADIVSVQKAFDAYRGNKMNHAPFTFLRATSGGPWTRLDGILSAEELEREARSILPAR